MTYDVDNPGLGDTAPTPDEWAVIERRGSRRLGTKPQIRILSTHKTLAAVALRYPHIFPRTVVRHSSVAWVRQIGRWEP